MSIKTNDYLTIRLSKDSGVENTSDLRIYLVNNAGNIIETSKFDGLEANLKTTGSAEKIYVGPSLPDSLPSGKANERTLMNIGAYRAVMNITNDNVLNIQRLPDSVFELPPFRFCNVTGHVNKNFTINDQIKNLPVCNARVHICNVERIFYWPYYLQPEFRIPDWLLNELKVRLATIHEPVLKIPPRPDPKQIFTPGFTKTNLPLRSLTERSKTGAASFKTNESIEAFSVNKNLQKLPDEVLNEIQSATSENIQESLIKYHEVLYPYICLWPVFWPWFYKLEEEAVVFTDCSGHFDAWLFYIGSTVSENIYIWVEVNVNGQWETVYNPPIPCYTKWNYSCGTDINILVSDSRVLPCVCDPIEGEVVWISNINGTSVRSIAMNATDPSLFSDARGLSKGFVSGKENLHISPFTSSFPIYVGFGNTLPAANITHFRWKYRRIADGYLNTVTDTFHYEQNPLSKAYTYFAPNANGITVGFTGNFQLDESTTNGIIYKIPHIHAQDDTGDATSTYNQYLTDTLDVNAASTGEHFGDGLFEFVLELCDNNGNVQNVDPNIFQVDSLLASPPNPASTPAGSIDANYLFHGTDNTNPADAVTGFRFLLRIDNNATTREIYNAVVDNNDGTGSTTETECGFAAYKDKATGKMLLRFDAEQAHNYADYSFVVYKGNNVSPVESYVGQVPAPMHTTVINGITVSYQENPLLTELLGTCIHAAFSENLQVTAYHTNGNRRYYEYDSSRIAAFAIEPVS